MTDIEQLRAAIQSGFDLLDKRLMLIEVMAPELDEDANKGKEEAR